MHHLVVTIMRRRLIIASTTATLIAILLSWQDFAEGAFNDDYVAEFDEASTFNSKRSYETANTNGVLGNKIGKSLAVEANGYESGPTFEIPTVPSLPAPPSPNSVSSTGCGASLNTVNCGGNGPLPVALPPPTGCEGLSLATGCAGGPYPNNYNGMFSTPFNRAPFYPNNAPYGGGYGSMPCGGGGCRPSSPCGGPMPCVPPPLRPPCGAPSCAGMPSPCRGSCGSFCQAMRPCPPQRPCLPPICPPPPLCPPPLMCPPPPPPCSCACGTPPMPIYPSPCGGGDCGQPYRPPLILNGGCGGGGPCGTFKGYPSPTNDCCCNCQRPCGGNGGFRAKARGVRLNAFDNFNEADERINKCNSIKLREILKEQISTSLDEAKRKIQNTAQKAFGKAINVICGNGEFSFVVHTNLYCQYTLQRVTCYAFETSA